MTEHAPLTEQEKEEFEGLSSTLVKSVLRELPEGWRVALVRSRLDGEDVAVVAIVVDEGPDEVSVTPMAMLITQAIFDRMEAPAEPGEDES